ncbi:hypothetical protein E2C01_032758 [Portunus trituberculatus]|uniref:Uncharacterized protein n=1 Tax=Portunus trituberculatus TaxID=210409 RepID=A0A5B7EW33_PORTR|nr:hypothetical protein [Portunus trituberculatus]
MQEGWQRCYQPTTTTTTTTRRAVLLLSAPCCFSPNSSYPEQNYSILLKQCEEIMDRGLHKPCKLVHP